MFAEDSFEVTPASRRAALSDTVRETLRFFRQGNSVEEIARIRGLKDGTIYVHLEEALLAGETIDVDALVSAKAQREIAAAFERHGCDRLSLVIEALGGKFGYGPCRVVRAAMRPL
jgi:ATP-dependent DNA helicase RecQ